MSRSRLSHIGLLALLLSLLTAATAPAATFPLRADFRGESLPPGWQTSGNAAFSGDGWMRLTPTLNESFGAVYNDLAFPSQDGLLAKFDLATWGGGQGADGTIFFLYDGATTADQFELGPAGGTLGYAKCVLPPETEEPARPGLRGAYLGVALDEFGNFSSGEFCGNSGLPGQHPNRIVVRGGDVADGEDRVGAGDYAYLGSVDTLRPIQSDGEGDPDGMCLPEDNIYGECGMPMPARGDVRHVTVAVVGGNVEISMEYPETKEVQEFSVPLPAGRPETLKLGFAAATGGLNNNHEIRDVEVVLPADLRTVVERVDHNPISRTEATTWRVRVDNLGPNPVTGAALDTTLANLQDATWTCSGDAGACPAESGAGVPDVPVDLDAGESATFHVSAVPTADTTYVQVAGRVTHDGAGATGDHRPANNAMIETSALPPRIVSGHVRFELGADGVATDTTDVVISGDSVTETRQWQRCRLYERECEDIPGATGPTYTVQPGDAEWGLRLARWWSNPGGTIGSTRWGGRPYAGIWGGPHGTVGDSSARFDMTTDRPGAAFECRLDDGEWIACASSWDAPLVGEGPHRLVTRVTYGGLRSPDSEAWTWTVDATAPDTTLDAEPASPTKETTATFAYSAVGDASGFECRVDGAEKFTPCGPTTTLTGLADGRHDFAVRARDGAGNVDPTPVEVGWTVDTAAPAEPTFGGDGPLGETTERTATLTFTGDKGATFKCRLDAGAWTVCTSPLTVQDLAVGTHTVAVKAVDAAGNESGVAVRAWTVVAPKETPAPVAAPEATPAPTAAPKRPTKPVVTVKAEVVGTTPAPGAGQGGSPGRAPASYTAVTVDKDVVDVGCTLSGAWLERCAVKAYEVTGAAGARTSRAARLIGAGRAVNAGEGRAAAVVDVKLNAYGRRLLAGNPAGLKADLVVDATPVGATDALRTTAQALLVPPVRRIAPPAGQFAERSAALRPAVRTWLSRIAPLVADSTEVRCVGHTSGPGDRDANAALGLRRAKAVCAYLGRRGVKAELATTSRGQTSPRRSNATAAGRAANRRVELVVTRAR